MLLHAFPSRRDLRLTRNLPRAWIKVVSDSQLIRTEPIPDLGARIGLVEHWESD